MAHYEENPSQITRADVVIAVPSFNEADTIGHTAEQLAKGFIETFGDLNGVLVNCDNNSADGTKEAFFSAVGEVPKIYLSTPPGSRGKGNNLRNLFEKVGELEAQIVIVVEADVKNIAPYWVRNLGEPVRKGVGFVCPLYVRHKYESPLTSSLVYPLTRCLYGRRVRQPNAGDFGFSGELAGKFLDAPSWTEAVQHLGVDLWMTTVAMNARVPICQTIMGGPKIHRYKDPFAQLSVLFHQVLGTVFDQMQAYNDFWHRVKWSKPTALFGIESQEMETPVPIEVNVTRLHSGFLQGFQDWGHVWQKTFEQPVLQKLQEVREMEVDRFTLPTQTWARILFDAATAYPGMDAASRTELLDSLLPLYLGKVLCHVNKSARMSVQQAEDQIESDCMVFEEYKPYLIERWR